MIVPSNRTVILSGLLFGAILGNMLAGCFERPVAPVLSPAYVNTPTVPSKTPAEAPPTKEQSAVEKAQSDVAELKGKLKKAQEVLDQKEEALRQKDLATLKALGLWMAGLAFIGAAGATAAAVFLPVFRTRLAMGAVACLSVMVLAVSVNAALKYLPVIGTIVFAAGFAALVCWLIRYRKALVHATDAGDKLEHALPSERLNVKRNLIIDQAEAKVSHLIADARGKVVKTIKDLDTLPKLKVP